VYTHATSTVYNHATRTVYTHATSYITYRINILMVRNYGEYCASLLSTIILIIMTVLTETTFGRPKGWSLKINAVPTAVALWHFPYTPLPSNEEEQ
jgi:hypothetical protein